MTFNYNGIDHTYPASLSEITLKQRIEFHEKYGITLEKKVLEVSEIEDITDRAVEEAELKLLFACQSFSFFTGIDLDVILETFDLAQIMNVYNSSLELLLAQEAELDVKDVYEFANERWFIASPQLQPNSKITFNEFITSKEIVRQMEQLGKGKWHSLLYLCCVYLRKEGEPFSEDLLEHNGERMKLMEQIPMDIALSVGFFLQSSMNIYLNILQSSINQEPVESI